ncbi:MAG: XRE family transcriptional regulator [Thermodesulfobacteriota bacterium]|nr:XRE family transcriptional regulator [Thermodesulfobacteriota bacterium]
MKTLKDIMNSLTVERREKIEARAEELIAEEMTLRDLRKAQDLTQERMAELLGVGQDNISRLEGRTDMLLSTLRSYVAAMGGSLDLIVRFQDRPAVALSALFGKEEVTKRKSRRRHSAESRAEHHSP